MILLRDPGLLFIKPHKVAGTSLEIALSAFAGPQDIITPLGRRGSEDEAIRRSRGFAGPRNYRWPLYRLPILPPVEWRIARRQRQWPGRFRSHLPAELVRERLDDDSWCAATKLSIVRNPYETAVSTYFWSRRPEEGFAEFWQRNRVLLSRNRFKYFIGDEEVIDLYLRYEVMDDGLRGIEQRWPKLAGIAEIFASLSAKSGYRPTDRPIREFFESAPEVAAMIAQDCSFEIARFGYRMPD